MTCTDLDELLGAYVLDAVSPEERTDIEAHLAQCPQCQQTLHELQEVVDLLPLSVPEVAPAPQLKNRIMAAIHEVANTSTPAVRNLQPLRQPIHALSSQGLEPLRTTPVPASVLVRRRVSRVQRLVSVIAVAAALLFLILSGALYTQVVSLQHQVTNLQSSMVYASSFSLTGEPGYSKASGEADYIHGNGVDVTVMTVSGLPKLRNQEVYQGWVIKNGVTKSVGLLVSYGNGTATISIPGSIKGNDTLAVSLEKGPTATSNAPQGHVLVAGKIPS